VAGLRKYRVRVCFSGQELFRLQTEV